MTRCALLLIALLPLAACVQSLDEGESSFVGNDVYAPGQPGYAQIHVGNHRYWTRHGTGLDELHFYTGIRPGEPLFPVNGAQKKDLPPWTARMTPNDIEDLVSASLERKGLRNVRATGLRPCPFGAAKGFCFDLAMASRAGLEMRGRVLAATRKGTLDLLLFTAPAEYYFGDALPAMDRVFAAIQTK